MKIQPVYTLILRHGREDVVSTYNIPPRNERLIILGF